MPELNLELHLHNLQYHPWIRKALYYGFEPGKPKGQRGRHTLLNRKILSLKCEFEIDDSKLITSMEGFINGFNQLIQQRKHYSNKEYAILSSSIGPIIGSTLDEYENRKPEKKNQLLSFLEQNRSLINQNFYGRVEKGYDCVGAIISRISQFKNNHKHDKKWIIGKFNTIINKLNSKR